MKTIILTLLRILAALLLVSVLIEEHNLRTEDVLYLEGERFYLLFGREYGDALVREIKDLVLQEAHFSRMLKEYDLLALYKLLYLRLYVALRAMLPPLMLLSLEIYLVGTALKFILLFHKRSPRKLHAILLKVLLFIPYLVLFLAFSMASPVLNLMLLCYFLAAVLLALCCALS